MGREFIGMGQMTQVKNDKCFDTLSNGELNYRELPFSELSFGELKLPFGDLTIISSDIIGRKGAICRVKV